MNTASSLGLGSLPGNTIANPKAELKVITTRSGLVLDGPSIPMPPPFINLEEDERAEETLMDPELAEYTIKVPPPLVQKATPPSLRNYMVHQRDPHHPHIPYPLRMNQEKQQEKDEIQIHKFWKIFKQLHINISFADALNLIPKFVSTNHLSGNPTLISDPIVSSSPTLTSLEESDLIWEEFEAYLASDSFPLGSDDTDFNPEGDLCLIEELLNNDPSSPLPLSHNPLSGSTTSSSPDHLLEEFADKLALITFPPGNDDLPFDIESDLREIEYFLNHDPTKEMDSILEDSVDEGNLADPNNDLVDTILKMFIDKHTLDYSSPPLYDDVDDDLVELESKNDDVYDDPFDSKEDKIKESKLLIDELDPPRSSDFLPSLECDSVLYEDFSEVDDLPSINNEDKVFNLGILIHEKLFEVTIRVTPDKNEKKISISNAFLILKDFNPPLYELLFHKEVPGIALDFEASRAHGFVLRSLELHILSFIMGIQYPNLID
ncbi:hypothetical protein Tco_0315608 [Tanacetum coccineum]